MTILPHAHAHAHTRRLFVLIACEESQAETIAFRNLGHLAFSCDIQKPRYFSQYHIQGDVTPLLQGQTYFKTADGHYHAVPQWDLIIAHPPCTYLTKLGAKHLIHHTPQGDIINQERLTLMERAAEFFYLCLDAKAHYVAVENPIPMKRAGLPRPSCYLHPSWFGVKYTKKTLFWLRNLPPVMPEIIYPNPKCYVNASRGKYRSRTFPQVAIALARQWTDYILNDTVQNH